jgi:hypothetical protein
MVFCENNNPRHDNLHGSADRGKLVVCLTDAATQQPLMRVLRWHGLAEITRDNDQFSERCTLKKSLAKIFNVSRDDICGLLLVVKGRAPGH